MTSNTGPPQQQPLLNLPAHHRASLAPYLPLPSPASPVIPINSAPPQPPSPKPSSTSPTSAPPTKPQLPHLTLTYATSLDSHVALGPGQQTGLSGPETKAMTHFLRRHHDAILVGATTAIVDDPSLNCRHAAPAGLAGRPQPVPVILDPSARWGAGADRRVLRLAREGAGRGVLWVVGGGAVDEGARERVVQGGGEVVDLGEGGRAADGGVEWGLLLEALAVRGIRSVMVEGGATVIMDLLKGRNQRFVDSVIVTIAPVWLGAGGVAVSPLRGELGKEVGRLEGVKWLQMGEDVVMAGRFGDGVR